MGAAMVAQVVPEPASVLLMAVGVLAVLGLARRRCEHPLASTET